MKTVGQFLIYLIISATLVTGCSTNGTVTGSRQGTPATNSLADSEQQVTPNGGATTISVTEIIKEYIPKPFNPVVHPDGLEFRGKWAGNVIPGLTQEMEKKEWALYDGLGAKKFYTKNINGHKVRISIVPMEKGGPQEKDASTFVKVELVTGK